MRGLFVAACKPRFAGSCGPGSPHFINGLYEANRNRAPVILIASQIARQDLGFESIQEVDLVDVYRGCSVFCEMILTPEQAHRKTVAACQAALTKGGVAVLVVPVDVANAAAHDEWPYSVHVRRPLVRPNYADLDEIAEILNNSKAITIYAGAGCAGAHDEVVATAARLKAPMAHTSRGKDFVEYDNPYNVGMTGIIGGPAGYHAMPDCDVLMMLGADFAWTQFYPDSATIIQIDADPTHIGRRHPVAIGAVGDIKTSLDALLPRRAQDDDNAFLAAYVERHRKDVETAKAETFSGPDAAISGTYLTKASTSMPQMTLSLRQTTARLWSGCFATSIPAASVEPLEACSTGLWQTGCHRRSGCRRASRAARWFVSLAMAGSQCCLASY